MKTVLYLSVTLLLSTVMYGMDNDHLDSMADSNNDTLEQRYVEIPCIKSEETLTLPTKTSLKDKKDADTSKVILKAVTSTIFTVPNSETKKLDNGMAASSNSATDLNKTLQKRGYLTTAKYKLYGKVPMLIHEIKNNTLVETRYYISSNGKIFRKIIFSCGGPVERFTLFTK